MPFGATRFGYEAAQSVKIVLGTLQPQCALELRLGQLIVTALVGRESLVVVIVRVLVVIAADTLRVVFRRLVVAKAAIQGGQVVQRRSVFVVDIEGNRVGLDRMIVVLVA